MKILKIRGNTGASTILIGESLRGLRKYVSVEKVVIITDANVRHYYSKDFPPCEVIEIGTGEEIKSLDTVQAIYGKLVEFRLTVHPLLSGSAEVLSVILPVSLHQPTFAE